MLDGTDRLTEVSLSGSFETTKHYISSTEQSNESEASSQKEYTSQGELETIKEGEPDIVTQLYPGG